MLSRAFPGILAVGMAAALVGCSDGPGLPTLVPGGGIVKYKGSPVAGATVMFVPEDGPLAGGTTDLMGKFKLMTGTLEGVAVGKCKVSVTAVEPGGGGADGGSSAPSKDNMQEKMMQATRSFIEKKPGATGPKSLIPEKYANADSSGLSYTVEKGGPNQFTIELN